MSIVPWDSNLPAHEIDESLIWYARLDDRYMIEVVRAEEEYRGVIALYDHSDDDRLLYIENVPLMYDAIFGPDAADVLSWQAKVLEIVDEAPPEG